MLNNPRRSPIRRRFTYLVPRRLDIEAMNEGCRVLVGEYDLASFASSLEKDRKNTVRRVYQAGVDRRGETVVFDIVANSFLPHQVRSTVGMLIKMGLGKMSINEFRSIMEMRRPGLAGPTVPACGLCLVKVNYPVPFEEKSDEDL
jgi:tRNA pseudouridine38-40 synthase